MAKESIIIIGFNKSKFDKNVLDKLSEEKRNELFRDNSKLCDYYLGVDDFLGDCDDKDSYWWYSIDTQKNIHEVDVHLFKYYGKSRYFVRIYGWTHDEPALIWSLTDTDVFFYDEKKGKVEKVVDNIDEYECRDGYFCLRYEDYHEAWRDLYAHDNLDICF